MDTVTYPHAGVRAELDHWLQIEVDVATQQQVTTLFGVAGIPVAIAVTGTGEVLGRLLGFIEPERFEKAVEEYRHALASRTP